MNVTLLRITFTIPIPMMNERRYPVGIQTFSEIINGGYVYVDKTDLMWQMQRLSKYIFLSRPRRFGKSLLSTTLCSFFEGRKDLFKGLKVMELEREWQSYPVIHLDLSMAKNMDSPEALRARLMLMLENYAALYGSKETEVTPGGLFQGLIRRAYEQTGRQVVLVIDEYDAPLLEVLHEEENLPKFRKVMQEFYQPLKSSEAMVRFCFITGITKFSQLSIFSTINNLNNISLLPQFSAICGITEQEVKTVFEPDIQKLADVKGLTWDEMFMEIKTRYDGYHFAAESEDIYNPFSLLKALKRKEFGKYWFETGTPTFLVEMLLHANYALENIESEEATADLLGSLDTISQTPIPLLFQSGYLTIKGYNEEFDSYQLGMPNMEVREGFFNFLLKYYSPIEAGRESFYVSNFVKEIRSGQPDAFMKRLESLFADGKYQIIGDEEKYFHNAVYIIFKMLGFYVDVEYQTSNGRIDLLMKTKDYIYIFEFKINENAETALKQINSKQYEMAFESDEKRIFKIGVNFSKKTKKIDSWKVL